MTFRSDSSRSSRAQYAEQQARQLVQEVLDREERVINNVASAEVDPWAMRFIVDPGISEGAIAAWRTESTRARRLMRRWDIQSGYREKLREVEKRIDAMLHLAENLEVAWDAAAAASQRLSEAEARDAVAFQKEREAQNNLAELRRRREEKLRRLRERAGALASDALDAGLGAFEQLRRRASQGQSAEDREVTGATARDLRKEPPLPED